MARPYSHTLQVAFDSAPDDPLTGMVWTDITPYLDVKSGVRIGRGRLDEFARVQPSTMALTLKNEDGRFTPGRNRNLLLSGDSDFEVSLGSWQVSSGCTITRVTTQGFGTPFASMQLTSTGVATAEAKLVTGSSDFTCVGGRDYRVGFASKANTVGRTTQLVVKWYNALSALIGSSTVSRVDDTSLFTYVESTVTAPASAVRYELYVQVLTPGGAGEIHWFDAIFFSASVFFPKVKVGKRIRYGLALLGNGKNLYADDPGFETTSGASGYFGDLAFPPTIALSSAVVRTGAQSLLITWGNAGAGRAYKYVYGTVPGRTYTVSEYLYVPTGSPDVVFAVNGETGVSMTTKNAWVRVTRTTVATRERLYFTINATSTAGGQICRVDDVQVEESGSATTFEPIGGTFDWRFTGDVTEWPLEWEGGPALWAKSNLMAVDRMRRFGDLGEFDTFLAEDILDDFPIAYYPLNEPTGSTTAGDRSENSQQPMKVNQIGTGGTLTLGWDHTDGATDYAVPDWYRDRSTGLQLAPSALGTPVTGGYPTGKYLRGVLNEEISAANGATGASVVCWARFPSAGASAFGPIAFLTAADGSYLGVHKSATSGDLTAIFLNTNDGLGGVPQEVTHIYGALTDQVLQLCATLSVPSAGNGLLTFIVNGTARGTIGPFVMPAMPRWNNTTVGGRDKTVDGVARGTFSHAQFYDYAIAASPLGVQWFVGAQGRDQTAAGDDTTDRIRKLLQFRGLYGGSPITTLTVQGTSAKLIGPQEIEGDPNEAIQLVEATEDGVFYIGGDGIGVWQLRNYRYNALPAVTLASDQLDPDALTYRGDDYGLVNDVTANRPDGATIRVVNTDGIAESGRRKASITAIPQDDDDLRGLAGRLVGAFGISRNRLSGVKVSLLQSTQTRSLLLVEIGAKIRITSIPEQAPVETEDVYVEGWTELVSEEEWSLAFNTSPASPWDAWQVGVAGRSEIGMTTIVRY